MNKIVDRLECNRKKDRSLLKFHLQAFSSTRGTLNNISKNKQKYCTWTYTLGPFPDTRGETLLGVGFSLLAGDGIAVSLGLNVKNGIPYRAIASVGLAAHQPLFFT